MTDSNDVLREKLNIGLALLLQARLRRRVRAYQRADGRPRAHPGHAARSDAAIRGPRNSSLIDLDGKQYGSDVRLPGELPIHLEVYKARPDVGSVAHFHPVYPTSFTMSSAQLKPTYFLASIFRGGVPVHPDPRLILDGERGAAMAKTLGPHRALLLKAHGIVTTGATVEEMTAATFILEENAHRTWIAATMGEVEYLGNAIMGEIEAEFLKTQAPFKRIWTFCVQEAKDAEG